LKYFQTLVKITHLKNKMHQHDLHIIVAKPMINFILKKNIIFPMFYEHKNTKLNYFSSISKRGKFRVLQIFYEI